jgi:hypothetical protein
MNDYLNDDMWGGDPHYGMESDSAGDPYTNRGRTEAVWYTLAHYGFRRSAPGSNSFEGNVSPSTCFESFVRKMVKQQGGVLDNGEINSHGMSIKELAHTIRTNHQIGYLNGRTQNIIQERAGVDLVKQALSGEIKDAEDLYYSFCRGGLEQSMCTWHCRVCKKCKDWRDWHCKGCNKCQYGAMIPCSNCSVREFAAWKQANGC